MRQSIDIKLANGARSKGIKAYCHRKALLIHTAPLEFRAVLYYGGDALSRLSSESHTQTHLENGLIENY